MDKYRIKLHIPIQDPSDRMLDLLIDTMYPWVQNYSPFIHMSNNKVYLELLVPGHLVRSTDDDI